MRNRNLKAWWLCALCALVLCATACSDDDEDETDAGTTTEDTSTEDTTTEDTTMEDTTMEDTTMEDTTMEDTTMEDTTMEDTTMEDGDGAVAEGACTNPTDTAILEAEGYSSAMGAAVAYIAQQCLLGNESLGVGPGCPTTPDACNCDDDQIDNCGIEECVANTIRDYTDGDVVDAGLTAEEIAGLNGAILAVQANPVSDECMGCSAAVPNCVLAEGCAFAPANCASDPDTCACQGCQCEAGCVDDYVACSGRDPYILGCPSPTPASDPDDACTE